MFASLKNKIKEETGADLTGQRITNLNSRLRSSTMSVNSTMDDGSVSGTSNQQHMSDQLLMLRSQCNELTTKMADLNARLQTLQEEKSRVEKTNEILLETVKVAQTQKDIYCEEQDKIQNIQQTEIDKLKSLLSFREQEAVDRLAALHQSQQQIENLTSELERLKQLEPMTEDLQDELERLRHSTQLDKNNLTTTLAAVEEENRHLKMRLQTVEQARLETLNTLNADEKVQALVQERKLLEQHLEETHLQLSDIKSSWSGQNLALETQVSRLSKQVAEETTEKRKIQRMRDNLNEKVKQLEFEMMNLKDELKQRDDKIKLLEEEIDELNSALKESREESEHQILFERNNVKTLKAENITLNESLDAADKRFSEVVTNGEQTAQTLRQQNAQLQQQLADTQCKLELEKEEKLTALLRNAEISQSEEILKKDLRIERDDANELHEKNLTLQTALEAKQQELTDCTLAFNELKSVMHKNEQKLKEIDEMQRENIDKNKTIKVLNQRLSDLKKTLQKEFRTAKSFDVAGISTELLPENGHNTSTVNNIDTTNNTRTTAVDTFTNTSKCCSCNGLNSSVPAGGIVMDEVNFKYLKHVIVKFLTSREVEARHLIRAVATLLKLSKEEEQLLQDTLDWKMSWFGSKPSHRSGQRAFSIPPS